MILLTVFGLFFQFSSDIRYLLMEFLIVLYPFLEALFHGANSLSTVLQLFADLLYFIFIFLRFLSEVIILILKVEYFIFVFFAIFFQQLDSFLQIFIFTL